MSTTPTTVAGAVRKYDIDPADVREGADGLEVTCKGGGIILDMHPKSVLHRHYKGDIEGQKSGRDIWLKLSGERSVLAYLKDRKPAGRPVENGAGLNRSRKKTVREPGTRSGGKRRPTSKTSKRAVKKSAPRKKR